MRRVRHRGLLDYPLVPVTAVRTTTGGNPLTNPALIVFRLACGHTVEMRQCDCRRSGQKHFRCDQCPPTATTTCTCMPEDETGRVATPSGSCPEHGYLVDHPAD